MIKKETKVRRPNVTNKYKDRKLIQIINMACPSDHSNNKKVKEKLLKYQQMAYKTRKRRPGYHMEIIPVVIECIGSNANKLRERIAKVLETDEKKMART